METKQYQHIDISWNTSQSKTIYKAINDNRNGGLFEYKYASAPEYGEITKNINDKIISENLRDTVWLISVKCEEDETLQHPLQTGEKGRHVGSNVQI